METTMFSFQTVGVFTGGTLVYRLRVPWGPPVLTCGYIVAPFAPRTAARTIAVELAAPGEKK